MANLAGHLIDKRPARVEPRAVKPSPKRHELLNRLCDKAGAELPADKRGKSACIPGEQAAMPFRPDTPCVNHLLILIVKASEAVLAVLFLYAASPTATMKPSGTAVTSVPSHVTTWWHGIYKGVFTGNDINNGLVRRMPTTLRKRPGIQPGHNVGQSDNHEAPLDEFVEVLDPACSPPWLVPVSFALLRLCVPRRPS